MIDPWDERPGAALPAGVPEAEIGVRAGGGEVGGEERLDILAIAASFTTARENAWAVALNALPLLVWAEDAPDRQDQLLRLRAMTQHRHNRRTRLQAGPDALEGPAGPVLTSDPAADNPCQFLAGAEVLYSFAVAGDVQ
jgi:hypothetical protein